MRSGVRSACESPPACAAAARRRAALALSLDPLRSPPELRRSAQARAWVAEGLTTDNDEFVNTFEATIRVLGGLLSAFLLSPGDPVRRGAASATLGRRLTVLARVV
jgi:hypothetical protein